MEQKPGAARRSQPEISNVDMENFRHEILGLIAEGGKRGKKKPIGWFNLWKVIPGKLEEADAQMWYRIRHNPGQVTIENLKFFFLRKFLLTQARAAVR